jgi:hypothetical protein
VRVHRRVCSLVVVTAVLGGCGAPPADRGPRDVALALSKFVRERQGGTLTGVRCEREIEHEYRCMGDYRDPIVDDPALIEAMMSTEKDGIPSMSRESAIRLLEDVWVTRRRYVARFDPRERAWSYKRLCERCR